MHALKTPIRRCNSRQHADHFHRGDTCPVCGGSPSIQSRQLRRERRAMRTHKIQESERRLFRLVGTFANVICDWVILHINQVID